MTTVSKTLVNTPYTPNPETAPRILSAEDKAKIAEDRQLEDLERERAGKAKYKIEVMFNKNFSLHNPSAGIVSFWENANQMNGEGDTIVHFCPGRKLKINDCNAAIPDPSHGYGFLVCPECGRVWKGDQVDGQVAARLPIQKWADLILLYYRKLKMSCDIVVKYHSADLRSAAGHKNAADALYTARSDKKRVKRIYTLNAIIKDTSTGAALYDRILAFLRA